MEDDDYICEYNYDDSDYTTLDREISGLVRGDSQNEEIYRSNHNNGFWIFLSVFSIKD